jgi:hypothetical protein
MLDWYIITVGLSTYLDAGYPDHQLAVLAWPFGSVCREFYESNLSCNYWLLDQVQYSVMASRTSNQALSKGLDTGTYYKW